MGHVVAVKTSKDIACCGVAGGLSQGDVLANGAGQEFRIGDEGRDQVCGGQLQRLVMTKAVLAEHARGLTELGVKAQPEDLDILWIVSEVLHVA